THGHYFAAINVNTYPNSTIGPFNEIYFSIPVKPLAGGVLDSGLFVDHFYCNNQNAISHLEATWGHRAKFADINLIESDENISASVEQSNSLFSLTVDSAPWTKIEEKYEMYLYYLRKAELCRTKFTIDTLGKSRQFHHHDVVDLSSIPLIQDMTVKVEFRPINWVLHENLFSLIYSPSIFSSPSTY
ncbi:MAG: hypothetical protein V4692_00950, partial [Bdellovibrionota bacterium]